MTPHEASALLAIIAGLVLLPFLFIPYVAWSYRRHGSFSVGRAGLAAGTLVYLMALWTYTILPLPDPSSLDCSAGGVSPQFTPLASLSAVGFSAHGWRDPMAIQLIANVALFIPFGMLTRHLFAAAHPVWLVLAGLGTSLLIETTQLTGIFGIYPCAYRMFDVDDLLTNTAGAALGVGLAPLLNLWPGRRPALSAARPVTSPRRLLGMAVDLVAVGVIALITYLPIAVRMQDSGSTVTYTEIHGWVLLPVAATLLLGVPLLTRGATLGQLVTYTRPIGMDGEPPQVGARLLRFAAGSGGYFLITSLGEITGESLLSWIANAWLVISAAAVMLWHPRGVSGLAAGLTIADSRDSDLLTSRAHRVDPRSLGIAVLAALFTIVLAWMLFSEISALAPAAGLALAMLVVGALALVTLGLVPYLVVVGIVTIRKEQVSVSTLLPLLTAAALIGLLVALIVGFATATPWLFVLAAAGSALSGYLGSVFFVFLLYGQWYARRSPEAPVDAVVVLGSRVFGDQVPPLLAARIDRGIEVLDELLAADPEARTVLVCSGGKGSDEDIAEGEAMARYARAHGAPSQRVLVEDESRNTEENLQFTTGLLTSRGLGTRLIAVTNDYHAFRTAIISREIQIDAQVIGARTARYYFPGAIIREFAGVLMRRPLLHGGFVLALTAFGAAIALLITQ